MTGSHRLSGCDNNIPKKVLKRFATDVANEFTHAVFFPVYGCVKKSAELSSCSSARYFPVKVSETSGSSRLSLARCRDGLLGFLTGLTSFATNVAHKFTYRVFFPIYRYVKPSADFLSCFSALIPVTCLDDLQPLCNLNCRPSKSFFASFS